MESYRILPWNLTESYGILQSLTESHGILQNHMESYRALPCNLTESCEIVQHPSKFIGCIGSSRRLMDLKTARSQDRCFVRTNRDRAGSQINRYWFFVCRQNANHALLVFGRKAQQSIVD